MNWEYQTVKFDVAATWGVKFDADEAQNFANDLGARGWELVSAFSVNEANNSKEIVFIFKRPLGE